MYSEGARLVHLACYTLFSPQIYNIVAGNYWPYTPSYYCFFFLSIYFNAALPAAVGAEEAPRWGGVNQQGITESAGSSTRWSFNNLYRVSPKLVYQSIFFVPSYRGLVLVPRRACMCISYLSVHFSCPHITLGEGKTSSLNLQLDTFLSVSCTRGRVFCCSQSQLLQVDSSSQG